MTILNLFDPAGAALVLGGTLAATLARTGWRDMRDTVRVTAGLATPGFDFAAQRAALAGEVEAIRQDGVLRARLAPVADSELADATAALARHRSVSALIVQHEQHRARREDRRRRACATLEQAAELGPHFGLVGTLVGLSQLPAAGIEGGPGVMAAVSTAIVTTLYGLLLAHLVFLPLAGLVERRGRTEEDARERLIGWLAQQVAPACPPGSAAPSSGAQPAVVRDMAA